CTTGTRPPSRQSARRQSLFQLEVRRLDDLPVLHGLALDQGGKLVRPMDEGLHTLHGELFLEVGIGLNPGDLARELTSGTLSAISRTRPRVSPGGPVPVRPASPSTRRRRRPP